MKQEEATREEKQAIEKIAAILVTLTSNRSAMVSKQPLSYLAKQQIHGRNFAYRNYFVSVSEASGCMKDMDIQDNRTLQQQMSMMQQVSADVGKEMCKYIEKVESHFVKDTFSAAESRGIMEDGLQEW